MTQSDDDVIRVRAVVRGRVQGVGYRYRCAEQARLLHLAGWVRNLDDGRVEATFEGRRTDVAAALAWCRQGPPHAAVTGVEAWEEPPAGEQGFRVRTG